MTAVDWERAPEGATHWAMDADGRAFWYVASTALHQQRWLLGLPRWAAPDFGYSGDCRDSLVMRPVYWAPLHEPTDHEWELAQVMDEVRTLRDRIQMAPRSTVYFPGLPFKAGTTYALVVLEGGE